MALFVLHKYYRLSKTAPAYVAAILLDPSKRKQYMMKTWDPSERNQMVDQIQAIWETKYKNLPTIDEPSRRSQKKRKIFDYGVFDLLGAELDKREDKDEFLSFINDPPMPRYNGFSPLQWWCSEGQRLQYPRLHRMALDIFSIPSMTDAPERIFSGGRRAISWGRAKLRPNHVEMLETLSNWVSQSFIQSNEGMEELLEAIADVDDNFDEH
jgi:hAT family C-terminal dimerisation region